MPLMNRMGEQMGNRLTGMQMIQPLATLMEQAAALIKQGIQMATVMHTPLLPYFSQMAQAGAAIQQQLQELQGGMANGAQPQPEQPPSPTEAM